MNTNHFKTVLIACLLTISGNLFAAKGTESPIRTSGLFLVIRGTGNTAAFTIDAIALPNNIPISITAPSGFTVTPTSLPADAKDVRVEVTLISYKRETTGQIILRSGDVRSFVDVQGFGAPLPEKDLSISPVYKGKNDNAFEETIKDGFNPSGKGYTVEFRIKIDKNQSFFPYAVDNKGTGFKGFADDAGMGVFVANSRLSLINPGTSKAGGLQRFYNDDGRYHTYRYTVTPDDRAFIYRDGLPVDTLRLADLQTQPDFAVENGVHVENLLKNPNFEGEYDLMEGANGIVKSVEGWQIAILDRWNSEQFVVAQEIDNERDFNNRVFRIRPYKWATGWGNGQLIQIVDAAPNETYALSALVRGGIQQKENKITGKMIIQEVDDPTKKTEVQITGNEWKTYSLKYTTSVGCRQLCIIFQIGSAPRGASVSPLEIDNVKLSGLSRRYSSKIGFENNNATIDYFHYDLSGAYAPVTPKLTIKLSR
jgi:hypothetical protein